jgi:phosphoglycerol transferase MdoB-like AlkP superfamily enzyme
VNARHVILIIEESFAGPEWWDLERRAMYMPNFDRLAEQSAYFDNIYAAGSRTTRGMESLLNGHTPLPGIALSERDQLQRLPSLARTLGDGGFRTSFVYGGWPDFSSFFTYWKRIGFHEMLSRDDFPEGGFETSWGVSDERLFDRLISEMDRLTSIHDKVFVATLTVSNHRPFDFPLDSVNFPADERKAEYAIAYADWALAQFIEVAKQQPWFEETLIVVTSDHGPRPDGAALIPFESYRVPLVFMHPDLEAREHTQYGSLVSVPLTIVELLGLENTAGFHGQNLFAQCDGPVPVEHAYHVGMVDRQGMTVLVRGGGVKSWTPEAVPTVPDYGRAVNIERVFREAHQAYYRSP